MKNTKKNVGAIVGIFALCLGALAAISFFLPKGGTEKPQSVPLQQSQPPQEQEEGFKAMWISYLEYQKMDFSTRDSFISDITKVFDNCKNMGLNTVIVHVRPFGDAMYQSSIFPYSHLITGTQGQAPSYDPLEEMVKIAHSKGLKIEAWVNPYRVALNSKTPSSLAGNNPAKDESLTFKVDGGIYYNPALPQVRDLVVNGVKEIIQNYNVDGIHFDDYFYPTTDSEIDKDYYEAYSGNLSQDDWRRENVNTLIRQVYSAIKEENPSITFGISPQGNDDNNYNSQYSDVKLWLSEEGYADYIMPQLYWGFDYLTKSESTRFQFKELSLNWSLYKKAEGTKLYIGLGAYRIGAGDGGNNDQGEWQTGDNLAKMIEVIKANPNLDGYAIYRYDSLFGDGDYGDLQQSEVENITKAN